MRAYPLPLPYPGATRRTRGRQFYQHHSAQYSDLTVSAIHRAGAFGVPAITGLNENRSGTEIPTLLKFFARLKKLVSKLPSVDPL